MRGGVGKIGECLIHFSKKFAKTLEKRRAVRANFCKDPPGEVGEQPNEAVRVITNLCLNKRFAVTRWADARKRQLRSTQSQMLQRRALKLKEGTVPRGMHHFQNKFAAVARFQM